MILETIVAHKRQEIAEKKQRVPRSELTSRARKQGDPLDLVTALQGDAVSLIAEIKRASPSKGMFAPDLQVQDTVRIYAEHGASAISVLTDERYFSGTLADLTAAKACLVSEHHAIPVLRKEFILDPYQIVEARAHGADAVLLIARIVSARDLADLYAETRRWGMAALIEVHDETDIKHAIGLEAPVLGINNRNLADFRTDLSVFGRLRSLLPPSTLAVAESGVRSAADIARLKAMGANAVLVGEALITSPAPAAKIRELVSGESE